MEQLIQTEIQLLDNPMAISDLVIFLFYSNLGFTTYNYTIDGDILTLTYEEHDWPRFNVAIIEV